VVQKLYSVTVSYCVSIQTTLTYYHLTNTVITHMSTDHEFILDDEGHEGIVKSEKKIRKLGESTFDFYIKDRLY
jgi:hypothetical protein